jgi:hypothetical protein
VEKGDGVEGKELNKCVIEELRNLAHYIEIGDFQVEKGSYEVSYQHPKDDPLAHSKLRVSLVIEVLKDT